MNAATTRDAGMRQHVAYEVEAATPPGAIEDLGDGCLQPSWVPDDELDAAQITPLEKAAILPSTSPQRRLTWLLEIPVMPSGRIQVD